MRPLPYQELSSENFTYHSFTCNKNPDFFGFFTVEHGTEMSLSICLYSLPNNTESSSRPLRDGSLKLRKAESTEL